MKLRQSELELLWSELDMIVFEVNWFGRYGPKLWGDANQDESDDDDPDGSQTDGEAGASSRMGISIKVR